MEETDYSNLTRSQRRKLKREQIKKELSIVRDKQKIKKKIIKYAFLLIIILALAFLIYWRFSALKNAPIIEITPESYNFGSVSQENGIATTTLTITNKGNNDLIIKNMDASCGCTSASVIYKGIESPRFSMSHGSNPKNWKVTIPPDDSAQLKIFYDPNVHKDLQGSVTRSVFVFSNDPRHSKKEVIIKAFQTR